MAVATIEAVRQSDAVQLVLSGEWTLATMPQPISGFELRLRDLAISKPGWDLRSISRLDSAGAILLWRAWGRQWPASLAVSSGHRALLERVEAVSPDLQPEQSAWSHWPGSLFLADWPCPLATIWRRWLP
jgi:phospholipid/cholesterol/gamma-HCH transport system permease protein